MQATSRPISSSVSSDHLKLVVRRHPRARTMRLAIDARDGALRLTLPPRVSIATGLRWAEEQRPWIERARAALPPAAPLVAGGMLPIDGIDRHIRWDPAHGRMPVLSEQAVTLGGPEAAVAPRLLRWLKTEAQRLLEGESRSVAAAHGIVIGRVSLGDPQGRWASCSSSGDLRYSWRLVMAPASVRSAVVAHEIAHRLHMNHSPAFHAALARLLGHEPAAELRWLREHGARLQRIGR